MVQQSPWGLVSIEISDFRSMWKGVIRRIPRRTKVCVCSRSTESTLLDIAQRYGRQPLDRRKQEAIPRPVKDFRGSLFVSKSNARTYEGYDLSYGALYANRRDTQEGM